MKKRSAARTPRSLDSYTFLAEESLGKRLAHALTAQGLTVVTHVDHPEMRGINDEAWAKLSGEAQWITISKDNETRYKPNECEAIVRYKARVIQFARGAWNSDQMIEAFFLAKARLQRLLARQPGPFIARINKKGEITRVFAEQELTRSGGTPTDVQ